VDDTGDFHTLQLVSTCRLFRKNELIPLMDKIIGFLYLDKIIGFLYLMRREEISVPLFALSDRVARPAWVNPSVWTDLSRRNVLRLILKQLVVRCSSWVY